MDVYTFQLPNKGVEQAEGWQHVLAAMPIDVQGGASMKMKVSLSC